MKYLTLVAGIVLAVGPAANPAWGHAGFEDPKQVMAGSDQTLTQSVPEERGPDLHNAKIVIEVPAAFEVNGCRAEGWECSTTLDAGGGTLVTFSGTGPRELFRYDVHTPETPGDYSFTTSQTYSDGKVVLWNGPVTSDKPAAVVKVVAGHQHRSGAPSDEAPCAPEGPALRISAENSAFDTDCLAAPAGEPFTVALANEDPLPHNVVIHHHGSTKDVLFRGELFTGPKTVTYSVGPLTAGTYHFHCEAHPAMNGTFLVGAVHAGGHAEPQGAMDHAPEHTPAAAHAAGAAPQGPLPHTGAGQRATRTLAGLALALGGLAFMAGARRPDRD